MATFQALDSVPMFKESYKTEFLFSRNGTGSASSERRPKILGMTQVLLEMRLRRRSWLIIKRKMIYLRRLQCMKHM